ncbi:hypothetical protein ACJX0J_019441, partial [Zea mays]
IALKMAHPKQGLLSSTATTFYFLLEEPNMVLFLFFGFIILRMKILTRTNLASDTSTHFNFLSKLFYST